MRALRWTQACKSVSAQGQAAELLVDIQVQNTAVSTSLPFPKHFTRKKTNPTQPNQTKNCLTERAMLWVMIFTAVSKKHWAYAIFSVSHSLDSTVGVTRLYQVPGGLCDTTASLWPGMVIGSKRPRLVFTFCDGAACWNASLFEHHVQSGFRRGWGHATGAKAVYCFALPRRPALIRLLCLVGRYMPDCNCREE